MPQQTAISDCRRNRAIGHCLLLAADLNRCLPPRSARTYRDQVAHGCAMLTFK
jgi:hypothetical protein